MILIETIVTPTTSHSPPVPAELHTLKRQIESAPDSVAEAALAFYSQLLTDKLSIKSAAICTSFKFFR